MWVEHLEQFPYVIKQKKGRVMWSLMPCIDGTHYWSPWNVKS